MSKPAKYQLRPGLLGICRFHGYFVGPMAHRLAVILHVGKDSLRARPLSRHRPFIADRKIDPDNFTPLYAFGMRIADARLDGRSVGDRLEDAVYLVLERDPELPVLATNGSGQPLTWGNRLTPSLEPWLDIGVITHIDMNQRPEALRSAA